MFIVLIILIVFVLLFFSNSSKQENLSKVEFLVKYGDQKFIDTFGLDEYKKLTL